MANTPTSMLSFDPTDHSGVIRLSWGLDGHDPVIARLQPPFAQQNWESVVRAFNAYQFPDYDCYPAARFAPEGHLLSDDGTGNYDPVGAARPQMLLNMPPLLG